MDPKSFRRAQNAPKRKIVTNHVYKDNPEWNSCQHDMSKYKLTDSEVEQRKQQRRPRPRGQEPLIGDKFILNGRQVQDDSSISDELNEQIGDQYAAQIIRKNQMDKEIVRNQVAKTRQKSAAGPTGGSPSQPEKTEVNINDEQLQKIVAQVVQQ